MQTSQPDIELLKRQLQELATKLEAVRKGILIQLDSNGLVIGTTRIYMDSGGNLYQRTNDGGEIDLTAGGVGGAPLDATYLVTAANGTLTAEVVVGATPGGELGGTWATPTVDATHSGSAHHAAVTIGADGEHSLATQVLSGVAATAAQAGHATAAQITKLDAIEAAADVTDATNVEAAGAVMDGDIAPAEGFMRKTGAGTYTAHKSNLAAAVAPGVDDDSVAGYSVGSRWIDTTADKEYVCLDATVGAAVWTETTGAAGGGGSSIEDADGDTKIQTEEAADEDTIRFDAGATANALVLDATNLIASVNVAPLLDSSLNIGAADKYWANTYTDKLYLNATATLDGAAAGKVNITGTVQTDSVMSLMGVAPNTARYLQISPTRTTATGAEVCLDANCVVTLGASGYYFVGVSGQSKCYGASGGVGHKSKGLSFIAGAYAQDVTATFSELFGCEVTLGAWGLSTTGTGILTVTLASVIRAGAESIGVIGTGATCAVTTYRMFDGVNPANAKIATLQGLYINDCTLGTVANYLLELGPTPYLRLQGSGSWTPADYETPLFLGADSPATLQQVTVGANDSGGAGYRCLRIPNL